jgi:REP element-mobilizing transposase RayT
MKRDIQEFIREKREWTEPLSKQEESLGFRGWHSRGYLPHFDARGVLQMITYRLHDAMPASRRHEWAELLKIEDERARRIKIEEYLDAGHGECHLRQQKIASVIQENLLRFDGIRYRLLAWVIMPNHVHTLIEIQETPLATIVRSWKSYTANEANRLLGRAGTFWQPEYFDRYMRDQEHLAKAIRYIENNPVKARLVRLPAEWPFGSAHLCENRSAGCQPAS